MPKLVAIRTIGVEMAIELIESAIHAAENMGVSGFVVVFSRTGMLEAAQAMTGATPANVEIAMAKARTVLNMRRSTRLQRERMAEKGQGRDDFAGMIGSLFSGGVAIFSDQACKVFVGAIAFSGGTEEQDEEICTTAVRLAILGLHTDV